MKTRNGRQDSRNVRLKDLAARAGVTVTTVSRALNDKPDIGSETKRRIVELAAELGYAPNLLAAGLRTQRSSFIGAVIMDNANPFFAGVLRGIEDTARAQAYQTVLCNTDFSSEREAEAVRLLEQLQVAGILLFPVETDPQRLQALLAGPTSVVLMGRSYESVPSNSVVFDDPLGGYLATRHALSRGYPRVAYLAGVRGTSATERRLEGYRWALEEAGRPFDPELVIWGGRSIEEGRSGLKALMQNQRPPLAVFCLNDLVAIGALAAAQELGLRVPDDLGLIGYDDIPWASSLSVPLTTIASSHYGLGQAAARLLLDVIEGKAERSGQNIVLTPHLVVRASC